MHNFYYLRLNLYCLDDMVTPICNSSHKFNEFLFKILTQNNPSYYTRIILNVIVYTNFAAFRYTAYKDVSYKILK